MIQDNRNYLKEILKRMLSSSRKSKENNNNRMKNKNFNKTKITINKICLDKIKEEESYKANKINNNKTNN